MKKLYITSAVLFAALASWWVYLAINNLEGIGRTEAEVFGASYGVMALFGGIVGLFVSVKWGGFKSLIGKAIGFISLGLLAQEFGQLAYSYLGTKTSEVPYPSIGDIGYFGSVVLYIFALYFMIKALNVRGNLKATKNIALTLILPATLLVGSYYIFLNGYEADPSNKLATALDFGYPLGQAFYFALAILAYLLSRRYLGGKMKPVVIFLIFALLAQYAADFTFLFKNNQGTWQTAGINDLMYLSAYFIMTLSLITFGKVVTDLSKSNAQMSAKEEA